MPLTPHSSRRPWRARTAAVACLLAGSVLLGDAAPVPALALSGARSGATAATSTSGSSGSSARGWTTTADGTRRVAALSAKELTPDPKRATTVTVDTAARRQVLDGVGASLTESSARLLMGLSPTARTAALRSLVDPVQGAGVGVLRVPLGASDFASGRYTYDDVPAGTTDPAFTAFSLAPADAAVVPVLQQALQLSPGLRLMGTPWSAPAWMKDNDSLVGGSLRAEATTGYADYLVATVRAYADRGLRFGWLTLQNEPGYAAPDYPSMTLGVAQEADLAVALRSRLDAAGFADVQLVGHDHNWGDAARADALLDDPAAAGALAGTAWHCYSGDPSAQSAVHDAHPAEGIWFTECSGGGWATDFAANLGWGTSNLAIGSVRAWARSVLWWNVALDPSGGPHTGGCGNCTGVLTVDPSTGAVTRNVEWDVLALTGRAARPGAVVVGSSTSSSAVQTVAYVNPDGSSALVAYNGGSADTRLVVDDGGTTLGAPLPRGAVVSLVW